MENFEVYKLINFSKRMPYIASSTLEDSVPIRAHHPRALGRKVCRARMNHLYFVQGKDYFKHSDFDLSVSFHGDVKKYQTRFWKDDSKLIAKGKKFGFLERIEFDRGVNDILKQRKGEIWRLN